MQYSVFWKKCRGVAPLLYFIKKSNTFLENRGCSAPWEGILWVPILDNNYGIP